MLVQDFSSIHFPDLVSVVSPFGGSAFNWRQFTNATRQLGSKDRGQEVNKGNFCTGCQCKFKPLERGTLCVEKRVLGGGMKEICVPITTTA